MKQPRAPQEHVLKLFYPSRRIALDDIAMRLMDVSKDTEARALHKEARKQVQNESGHPASAQTPIRVS